MRNRTEHFAPVALIVALAVATVAVSGCANMNERREWGTCGVLGGLAGAAIGATVGIVTVQNTQEDSEPAHSSTKAWAGGGGAAAGALLGALAGHYLCDPIIPPPPPPPKVAEAPAPPPPPPPPPPPAAEKLVLRGVHFDFNKSDIRPADEAILDEAAATLKAKPNTTINVNGYCDAIGSDEYNLKLSQRRADAVVKYLAGQGIASSRLIPQGFGKTDFVATNDTAEGRAQNRRVELVPVGQ